MSQKSKKLRKIVIQVIPHNKQRYETCGDYWEEKDTLQVRVSQMSDWRYEVSVAVHEIVEAILCRHRGIKEKDITKFDLKFEKERKQGLHPKDAEPGFDSRAPYRREHALATLIETELIQELGIMWEYYEQEISNL